MIDNFALKTKFKYLLARYSRRKISKNEKMKIIILNVYIFFELNYLHFIFIIVNISNNLLIDWVEYPPTKSWAALLFH
ncbi:hypothetical protein MCORR_v1c03700 [Mesoplasma corruscae]|uniref:Uncharacterized protein n=1 Tax=Mesoplasma corruscae TaxID=216874 RepID=A0A2S5RHC4_9MOLU|nr:hypothetical protein MCORR_v1c03700 [Mesoplasma corruscae]